MLSKILEEGGGEESALPKYESVKKKKNSLEYFFEYAPRDVCNILLQSVQI